MTVIKICGITNLEDARLALGLGAEYLGFNFYPSSPRFLEPARCARLCAELHEEYPAARLVGVFVNAPLEVIRATLENCFLDLAQLHGDEPPEILAGLNGRAYKAMRGIPGKEFADFARHSPGRPALLLDSQVAGVFGGSGVRADWSAARLAADRAPIFLAGGLKPDNVAEAIASVRPWGVDTASGVDAAPGKKDPAKLKAFIQAVHAADRSTPEIVLRECQ